MRISNLEATAIILASEVETAISTGINVPTDLINALHAFRKAQIADDGRIGKDLEAMYANYTKVFLKTGTES